MSGYLDILHCPLLCGNIQYIAVYILFSNMYLHIYIYVSESYSSINCTVLHFLNFREYFSPTLTHISPLQFSNDGVYSIYAVLSLMYHPLFAACPQGAWKFNLSEHLFSGQVCDHEPTVWVWARAHRPDLLPHAVWPQCRPVPDKLVPFFPLLPFLQQKELLCSLHPTL